jgi:uncharacterized membrane protein
MDAKTKAIIAYFTPLGWIFALILNQNPKEEYTSFHLRQVLGIYLLGFATSLFGGIFSFLFGGFTFLFINSGFMFAMLQIGVFILWLIGLVRAVNDDTRPIPIFGNAFQEWLKGL